MSRRALVLILFVILQALACLSVALPYHRDLGAAALVALFVVATAGAVVLFVLWRRPVHHGIFFLIWAVALLVVFFAGWSADWFTATPNEGELAATGIPAGWLADSSEIPPRCRAESPNPSSIPPYGEAFACKGIYQPLSTLSDLAFIVAGFAIVLLASLGAADVATGRANTDAWLPLGNNAAVNWARPFIWGLGLVVIFMGPASMYLHASFRNWGGWMDSFSVYNLGLFGIGYAIFRLISYLTRSEVAAWVFSIGVYLVLLVTFGLIGSDGDARIFLIAIGIALWLSTEIAVAVGFALHFAGRGYYIAWGWGLVFLGLFATAGVFKFGIEETAKFSTAFQPHALFHILAASALPFAYLYWASERVPRSR